MVVFLMAFLQTTKGGYPQKQTHPSKESPWGTGAVLLTEPPVAVDLDS